VITVIGLDGSPLAPADSAVLAAATLVVGGRRHLAAAPLPPEAAVVELGPLDPALKALAGHRGDAVVLASGDPGFFGILRSLRERGLEYAVRPAVSSVALAFARAGLPWDDAQVVSAHGRDPRYAINVCRAHPKVAVLTGPGCGPAELAAALAGWQRRLVVAEHLGTPAERVTSCTTAEAASRHWDDPNVVIVLAERPPVSAPGWHWPPGAAQGGGWALPEADFSQQDAVITKAEVRALALARLAPGPGQLIWDVGAGTGSVGIECARLGAAVIAIERDPRRVRLIRDNSKKHGVDVRVIEGEVTEDAVPEVRAVAEVTMVAEVSPVAAVIEAPVVAGAAGVSGAVGVPVASAVPGVVGVPRAAAVAVAAVALDGLPVPDAVFIGGGGTSAVEAVVIRRPARIVVALAAVDRVAPACAVLDKAGYTVDGTLLQAARLSPLPGGVHRFDAVNPVFMLWASRAPGLADQAAGGVAGAGHGGGLADGVPSSDGAPPSDPSGASNAGDAR
jgi:precorrin-6Y C5,15-methyltransferase (decarboxylating)